MDVIQGEEEEEEEEEEKKKVVVVVVEEVEEDLVEPMLAAMGVGELHMLDDNQLSCML